jgi:hypothetical protein
MEILVELCMNKLKIANLIDCKSSVITNKTEKYPHAKSHGFIASQ